MATVVPEYRVVCRHDIPIPLWPTRWRSADNANGCSRAGEQAFGSACYCLDIHRGVLVYSGLGVASLSAGDHGSIGGVRSGSCGVHLDK